MERRHIGRTRVLKGAKLIFNRSSSVLDCVVRNLSNEGACIELATTSDVPNEFEVSLDSFRTARRCLVKWRTITRMGIAFT